MTATSAVGPEVAGLAVVVVNYGSPALLETYLRPTAPPGSTVVVVDNPSTPDARVAVTAMAQRYGWDLVLSERNDGFGAGVNRGVARALTLGCDRFLLLNPDCGATPEVVAALDAYVREHPLTFASARVMMPGVERPWFVGYHLDPRTGFSKRDPELGAGTDRWGWLTTPFVVVHRDLWERVGGFDPEYFLYWEDVDLCRRMVDAGGSLAVLQDLEAIHDVGGTQKGTGKSPLYCYYTARNRLLFASRHLGRRDQLRWLLRAPAAAVQIVLRSGPRQALKTPRTSWSALRGTVAGATILLRGLRSPGARDRARELAQDRVKR